MGKKSGITKGGRAMNPADRERKQQRAKELKRNKKQRTAVRHAIVKGRDPDEIIEAMSRLDEQEFDPQRQLSLNVIQEKRNKLRGSFYQIVGLYKQEKEEKKVKNLERMMFEYEVERERKEENFRAQMFSKNADFGDIPLPMGMSAPGSASTPFSNNIGSQIGPQIPMQFQAAMKTSILKKPTATSKKKHKHPPGPPPGLPPQLFDSDEDEEEGEENGRERDRRDKNKRVRFGAEPTKRRGGRNEDGEEGHEEYGEEDDDEDYAPVEIPDELLEPPTQSQQQAMYSHPVPSLAAPAIGPGPIMPGMAPPPPAYPPGFPIPGGRPLLMRPPHGGRAGFPQQMALQHSNKNDQSYPPDDPHPSAIISAEPQVVKPNVIVPTSGEAVISSGPQMRNIAKEATRFVPTAVKVGRSIVQQPAIGPRIPTSSSVAGPSKLVPRSAATKPKPRNEGNAGKSMDQACDEFLKELEGLF